MRLQPTPLQMQNTNDNIQTPPAVARAVMHEFSCCISAANRSVLDPAAGDGAFASIFQEKGYWDVQWCETDPARSYYNGQSFFHFNGKVDCVVTNPPWSQIRPFMEKAFQVSNRHVAFLTTLNHQLGCKARFRLAEQYGFSICGIITCPTPPRPWPQSGFQLGMVVWEKCSQGSLKWRKA